MRIAWMTDIHLNFFTDEGVEAWCERVTSVTPDAVLITGDISEAPDLERHLRLVGQHIWQPVFFVLGNHDFYRGCVRDVRAIAKHVTESTPNLKWLPVSGVVALGKRTALVGHDGWADGVAGNWEKSDVLLSDYMLISDLLTADKCERKKRMQGLAAESTAALRDLVREAFSRADHVVVATHVPPWEAACWHKGKISNDDWLPHFTSIALGEMLAAEMAANPEKQMTVYCGHTHSPGTAQILPNLTVHTGAAEYSIVAEPVIIEV